MSATFDEADRAFMTSLVPEGCVPDTLIAIVSWMDEGGRLQYRTYAATEMQLSHTIGLMRMAEYEVLLQHRIEDE